MNDQLMAQLARLLGNNEPLEITRVEFSATGRNFIAYNADGDGWGGDLSDDSLSVEKLKENLITDAKSGGLGYHFSIYEPVPPALLAEKRGTQTDWADIYNAA